VQVPRARPVPEQDWIYASALAATSAHQLAAHTQLLPLPSVVRNHMPAGSHAHSLAWSPRVLCTANFVRSVEVQDVAPVGGGPVAEGEYLRPVGALLLFPADHTACLVSEREADALLCVAWGAPATPAAPKHSPILVPLCHAQQAYDSSGRQAHKRHAQELLLTRLHAVSAKQAAIPWPAFAELLVHLQLFNGGTTYGEEGASGKAMRAVLRALVHGKRSAAEELVGLRGKMPFLQRSHLEQAAGDVN